jgi:glucose/arabinose dehydrogenase
MTLLRRGLALSALLVVERRPAAGDGRRRQQGGVRRLEHGRPVGLPVGVLSGFLAGNADARGRPVGVAMDRRGALLVADDLGNTIWRVTAAR